MVICLWVVSLSCLNMANAAAERTRLFLEVNRIVHMGLQHHQFLAVLSAAARASSTSAGAQEKGPLLGQAASSWGCNLLPTITLLAINQGADFWPQYASENIWVSCCFPLAGKWWWAGRRLARSPPWQWKQCLL